MSGRWLDRDLREDASQVGHLSGSELRADVALDAVEVDSACPGECLASGWCQRYHVAAAIVAAHTTIDQPVAFEAVDQSRHTATAESSPIRDLRRAQTVTASLEEHEQDLVVLGRKPTLAIQRASSWCTPVKATSSALHASEASVERVLAISPG